MTSEFPAFSVPNLKEINSLHKKLLYQVLHNVALVSLFNFKIIKLLKLSCCTLATKNYPIPETNLCNLCLWTTSFATHNNNAIVISNTTTVTCQVTALQHLWIKYHCLFFFLCCLPQRNANKELTQLDNTPPPLNKNSSTTCACV